MIVLYFNHDIHDLLMIFMGMWVIVNWWVWPVPDFHFRKLEAMLSWSCGQWKNDLDVKAELLLARVEWGC